MYYCFLFYIYREGEKGEGEGRKEEVEEKKFTWFLKSDHLSQ